MMAVLASGLALASGQWTSEQATEWGKRQVWSAGCNFSPSSAINQLEMWQADSFDFQTISREFKLMNSVGMSRARIYLHDLADEADPDGFKARMRQVLHSASLYNIRVMFVFFDDCWSPDPKLGRQPAPKPGVHNSGWVRSPGHSQRDWPRDLPRLKTYVQDVLRAFKDEARVWMWDLYNEPGNSGYGPKSIELLDAVFDWAREVRPSQPLTAAPWQGGKTEEDKRCLELSDVVTFHCYDGLAETERQIDYYKSFGRPVICSEWMARANGSKIATHLPAFKKAGVSCLQWGFVSGKTNTIFPWGSKEGSVEPKEWFHDLLRPDGTPFDPAEVALYRDLTRLK